MKCLFAASLCVCACLTMGASCITTSASTKTDRTELVNIEAPGVYFAGGLRGSPATMLNWGVDIVSGVIWQGLGLFGIKRPAGAVPPPETAPASPAVPTTRAPSVFVVPLNGASAQPPPMPGE